MKSNFRFAFSSAVALVLIAAAQPARAFCSNGRLIGEISNPYTYIVSPGVNTPASLVGSFWGLGGGSPTPGAGDDNGLDADSGNADPTLDWVRAAGGSPYLAGAWSNAGVDGCVDNATTPSPKRTIVALSDMSADGRLGYFGVFCKEADSGLNYDYATLGSHALVVIPYPRVMSSSRVQGVSVTVSIRNVAANISGGMQGDPSCAGLLRGYKVCSLVRPNASGPPTDRSPLVGWTCGNEIPAGQDSLDTTFQCPSPTSLYLVHKLVFESGFETFYVSQDVRFPCSNAADRPLRLKPVTKPRSLPER